MDARKKFKFGTLDEACHKKVSKLNFEGKITIALYSKKMVFLAV